MNKVIFFIIFFLAIIVLIFYIKKKQINKLANDTKQKEEQMLKDALLLAKKQRYDACYNECIKYVFNPLTGGIIGRPAYCNLKCTGQLEQLKAKYL
jgi:cbb3-type cytochrome oxidase subunit 3